MIKILVFWTTGSQSSCCGKVDGEVLFIRPEDLENHNKDGGLWVVIHGKVYDLHEFKEQVKSYVKIVLNEEQVKSYVKIVLSKLNFI